MPFPSPGDLPDPGIGPESPAWQAGSLPLSHIGAILKIKLILKLKATERLKGEDSEKCLVRREKDKKC